MNGKPKSARAVRLSAFHCKHPDLDGIDKALLGYLAEYVTHGTGADAHPGNRNIADALGLTDRPTDNRLAKNIARGLIFRTERADGRKKASVYRICLESPHFPDQTPGGEWLIEEPRCVDSADKEPRCVDSADCPVTALPDEGNRAAAEPKPRCQMTETALSGQPTTRSSPEEHHPLTSSAGVNLNSYAQVVKYLKTDMLASQWKHGEKEQVEALIAQHGGAKFIAAQTLYWRQQDPTQFSRTLYRWTALLNSFDGWLNKVKPEFLEELSWERWKKENPEEYKRQTDASIARQTVANQKVWVPPSPPENEESVEDFLKDE